MVHVFATHTGLFILYKSNTLDLSSEDDILVPQNHTQRTHKFNCNLSLLFPVSSSVFCFLTRWMHAPGLERRRFMLLWLLARHYSLRCLRIGLLALFAGKCFFFSLFLLVLLVLTGLWKVCPVCYAALPFVSLLIFQACPAHHFPLKPSMSGIFCAATCVDACGRPAFFFFIGRFIRPFCCWKL